METAYFPLEGVRDYLEGNNFRGCGYDMSHLHPHLWEVTIAGKDEKPDLVLKVNVGSPQETKKIVR